MLTVTFKSIINGVFHLAGLDPADASDNDLRAVIEAIADRYKTAHEFYKWPVFMDTEERWFRPVWSASSTYAEDDEIYFADADAYYVCTSPASAGESPTTAAAKWALLQDFRRIVDYEQAGETAIAAVLGAWDRDPQADAGAQALRYSLRNRGVQFSPDHEETSVWVEFRARAADFAAELYDAAKPYAAGSRVYFPDLGDVYRALEATAAGQTPGTHAAKWARVEFPEFLARAVKAGALSDWLTSDERPNAAAKWDGKFIELLDEQVWQLTKLQGQTGQPDVSP